MACDPVGVGGWQSDGSLVGEMGGKGLVGGTKSAEVPERVEWACYKTENEEELGTHWVPH